MTMCALNEVKGIDLIMIKKRLIIIISIIVIFSILVIILFLTNYNKKSSKDDKYKLSTPILEKIEKKETFLLFITDNYNKCSMCEDAVRLINYYSKIYNLDNIWFNKSSTTKEDFNNLIKNFDIENIFLEPGNILLIKDGVIVVGINEAIYENVLRNYLIEYKYIDNSDNDKSIEDNEFYKLYQKENKELILVYSADDIGYNYRGNLFKLSIKYRFKYSVIRLGFGDTTKTYELVINKMNNKYKLPVLMIVGNNKIIDYTTNKSNSKIEEFLRDNEFI